MSILYYLIDTGVLSVKVRTGSASYDEPYLISLQEPFVLSHKAEVRRQCIVLQRLVSLKDFCACHKGCGYEKMV